MHPTPTETALVVQVPELSSTVDDFRATLDHSARWGVAPHVTVLYPFLPPDRLTDEVLRAVGAEVAEVAAFDCVFGRVEWFGQDVVWLAPEPDRPFRVLTAAIARSFPDRPPYGGTHHDPIPHLTIGSTRAADPAGLRRAANVVAGRLPARAPIRRVSLLAGTDAPGAWHPVREFPLGPYLPEVG